MSTTDTTQDVFPRELLKQGFRERHNHFLEYKAQHAMLNYLQEEVLQTIQYPGDAPIVIVLGPTGVGKTTLRQGLECALSEKFKEQKTPSSGITAPTAYNKVYTWKAHFNRVLVSLGDPFDGSRTSMEELERACKQGMANHRLKAFFIDDGQRMSKAKDPDGQWDKVIDVADGSRVLQVILGTYELVPFLYLSAQLGRRSIWFEFKRYRWDRKGIEIYAKVLDDFQRQLPMPQPFDMRPYLDFMYERTIGCVGLLKSWLMRALDRAMKQKLHSLTLKMLEKTSPKAGLLEQMLDEAEKGERQMEEFDAKATYAALRERLGLGKPLPSAATAPSGSNQPKEPEATKPKPKKPKPGTTKPDRKESFAARKAILAKRASKK